MTLVDTNVIVDVLTANADWYGWSATQLARCSDTGLLHINEITYAELAVRIESETELTRILRELDLRLERMPVSALFRAGRAFDRYRAVGGPRTSLLPDFFIGAHAEIGKLPLLTRDVRRYRQYFPKVRLIAPEP
jgi:predicted nucleic acid-binding protein